MNIISYSYNVVFFFLIRSHQDRKYKFYGSFSSNVIDYRREKNSKNVMFDLK